MHDVLRKPSFEEQSASNSLPVIDGDASASKLTTVNTTAINSLRLINTASPSREPNHMITRAGSRGQRRRPYRIEGED
jgi:hypothetical protein